MDSSKAVQSIALVLCLNLLFFNMASATPLPACTATLDLSVCVSLIGVPLINIGSSSCCGCFSNLASLDAAACLCAYLKTQSLSLDVTATVTAIINGCGKTYPSGYQCL